MDGDDKKSGSVIFLLQQSNLFDMYSRLLSI